MVNRFSGREIVEIGVIIEQNGRDFYRELVSWSDDNALKIAFEYLAKEEEKHINYFLRILDKIKEGAGKEGVSEEFFSHISQLASQHVFTQRNKGKEMAKGVASSIEAIDMGIRFEKESIDLFEGMRKLVPTEDVVIVNTLLEEEEQHLKKLIDLKSTLK